MAPAHLCPEDWMSQARSAPRCRVAWAVGRTPSHLPWQRSNQRVMGDKAGWSCREGHHAPTTRPKDARGTDTLSLQVCAPPVHCRTCRAPYLSGKSGRSVTVCTSRLWVAAAGRHPGHAVHCLVMRACLHRPSVDAGVPCAAAAAQPAARRARHLRHALDGCEAAMVARWWLGEVNHTCWRAMCSLCPLMMGPTAGLSAAQAWAPEPAATCCPESDVAPARPSSPSTEQLQ